jgi:hypothetical protein
MSQLTKLREDHAALARLFHQLRSVIDGTAAPSQLVLFDLRRDLLSTLLAHLKLEDWALYPRLIESGDEAISETGRRFQEEMGGIAPAFVAYCDRWSANAIAADWTGYCSDTGAILDALENRVLRENRELLPLLEGLDEAA